MSQVVDSPFISSSDQDAFVYATSYAQRRLWFLSQLTPEAATYHIVSGFRLRGAWNVAALRAALNQIVARHESLRTAFEATDGTPVQVIYPSLPLPLTSV